MSKINKLKVIRKKLKVLRKKLKVIRKKLKILKLILVKNLKNPILE